MLTSNPKSLESFQTLTTQIPFQIQELRGLIRDNNEQLGQLETLQRLTQQRINLNEQMIAAKDRDDFETYRSILFGATLSQVRGQLDQVIREMNKIEETLYADRSLRQTNRAGLAAAVAGISILIATAMLILTGISLRREIAKHMASEEKLRER